MRHAAKVAEGAPVSGVPAGCDALLSSEVDYAVTYDDDGFASIAFADHYLIGGAYSGCRGAAVRERRFVHRRVLRASIRS